ncbi:MAG TPA: VIT domain-containing protein, partial [Pyrinomonadaceae bacterium]|nr:VIT domain-containing protein [Pyrinomonadaceae bacterium]
MQRIVIISLLVLVIVSFAFARQTPEGSLEASSKSGTELGTCPLKHTKVRTDISGFLARVTVEQEFENTFDEAIEAVYVFPLSANGAVDTMTMTIGQRTIRGVMMKREDARKAYEAAKNDGKTASLGGFKEKKGLVVVMTSATCPVSKRYLPSVAALEKELTERLQKAGVVVE